ncbi:(2Fe-2S)-binding protein [Corynebacterium sp. H130]|uniref:(2Fe-2S)-binding protein n=1 Tax=Corynebacterium sp. H130 TaxID=3133444 RepID=UPI0030A515C5
MSLPWAQLVSDVPRFHNFVYAGTPVDGTDWVAEVVRSGESEFRMGEKPLAQLWWFCFGNSVIAPSVHLMVGYEAVPSFDFSQGQLRNEGFWCGFHTDVAASSPRDAGAQLAESVAPLIDVLCSEFSLRPAPLWAITADALRQTALEAGNNNFDPALGVEVGEELVAGLGAGPDVPIRAVVDGAICDFEPELGDDCFVFARRASCCMIYRTPGSGLCTSCPKRPDARRERDMIALAEQMF